MSDATRPVSVARSLVWRAMRTPDRMAYAFLADGEEEQVRLTYAELDARARAIAAALARSARPGDRALLLDPPGLDFVAAFFGCLYAGVIAVPAYPPRSPRKMPRLLAILADARPAVVLAAGESLRRMHGWLERTPEAAGLSWIATDELDPAPAGWEPPAPGGDAVAFLQYTSGSTSTPKGVMVTQANLAHNQQVIQDACGHSEDSVFVSWLPVYHDLGLIGNLLQATWVGAPCILMAPVAFLQSPVRWLRAISRYRGTTSGGPNFAYDLCARRVPPAEIAQLDLSSWQVAFNGAEPVREETLARFTEAFAPAGFRPGAHYPCYGLAEATLMVSGGRPGAETVAREVDGRRLVGGGHVLADLEVAIVEPDTGALCPPGGVGEIWVAGASVASGYWNRPEETAATFGAKLEDNRGPWLRTGDLGALDAGGELFIAGRLKDLIILRGRNHYPQDLEATAGAAHPALGGGTGAAFAVEEDGEERLVIVHEVDRHAAQPDEIAAAIRQAIAEEHEALVYEVVLVATGGVPRTTSGKVQRRACRDLYLRGELRALGASRLSVDPEGAAADDPAAQAVPGSLDWLLRAFAAAARVEPSQVDPDRPLTAAGLDSLAAVELKHAVEEGTGVELPLADLLEGMTLREVEARVGGDPHPLAPSPTGGGGRAHTHPGEGESPEHPLSWNQRSLWFLHRLAPESAAYNIAGAARLTANFEAPGASEGRLRRDPHPLTPSPTRTHTRPGEGEPESALEKDALGGGAPLPRGGSACGRGDGGEGPGEAGPRLADLLGRALQALVDRHPMLRATFAGSPEGPVQRVAERAAAAFEAVDARGWSDAEIEARLHAEAFRPFDLAAGPLVRAALLERGAEAFFVLAVHHIAADFLSMTVLARELGALVAGEAPPPPAALYTDFSRRQQERLESPAGERLWEHWRERLAGTPQLDLPTDRPRQPVETLRGGSRTLPPLPERAEAVHRLAATYGCTPFVVLLAAWQTVLSRWSGQEEFLTGAPMAGRSGREWADVVGYFVNLVPLRAGLAGDPTVRALMGRTRGTVLDALAHQDFPFALLTERLQPERDPRRPPLVAALLTFEKAPDPELAPLAAFAVGEPGVRLDLGNLVLESVPLAQPAAQLDLSLMAAEWTAGLAVSLQWDADLFDEATTDRMLGHLDRLLAGMVREDRPVSELTGLSPEERNQLVHEWGAATGSALVGPDLCERIEAWTRSAPDHLAVAAPDGRLTYGELRDRARSLARRLRRLGAGPEVRVAVCLERSPDLVVTLLAVLESGAAYVPLDPAYPVERLAFLLEDSRAAVLVTRARYRDKFPAPHGARLVVLDEAAEVPEAAALPEADPGHLAYVIYTSGSTGRPKGVCIERASLSGLTAWHREAYGMGPADRTTLVASPAFDASAWEVWSCLAAGASLHIPPEELVASPPDLLAWLRREGITLCFLPTPLAEAVLSEALPEGLALRTLLTGGDRLRRAPEHSLPFALVNHYGPTESTVVATCGAVETGQSGPVPIGRPIPGVALYLLDLAQHLVPIGAPGEICLGGRALARGYLGAADRTAEKFIPSPWSPEPGGRLYRTGDLARHRPGGALEFLGRIDSQVKVRGFRIELGEIEAALLGQPGVREAVVVVRSDGSDGSVGLSDDRRLVAYVSGDTTAEALRSALQERLPAYMVPAAFVALAALPLTPNGKVDRKALPAPEWQAGGEISAAPRTPVEEVLAGIWAEVLGLERVGIHESFFELGGHSLLATRVVARLHAVFGVELPLRILFERPTVAELAVRVEEARRGGADSTESAPPPLLPVPRGTSLPLSFAQERLWFLDRLAPAQAVYNIPMTLRLHGPVSTAGLAAGLAAVADRHEALRTTFGEAGGRPVQAIAAEPRFPLALADLSGLPTAVRQAEAVRQAGTEARRPFDLAAGPLCRALLLRLGEAEHLFVINVHHIVFDGWSTGILLRELERLATGEPLPPLPVQYADFAVWQRAWLEGGALAAQLAAWRERLAGAPAALDLPVDRRRPGVQTFRGGAEPATLPAELVRALRAAGRPRGATLFMTVLAGWAALLHRSSGDPEVIVGAPVANRRQAELGGLIGLFVNTLPLRVDLGGDPSFAELLDRVRATALAAYENQDVPFERLVETVESGRDLSRSPLFQVMLALEDEAPPSLRLPGVTAEEVPLPLVHNGTAKLELLLALTGSGDGFAGVLEFNADLFDAATARRLTSQLGRLLAGAAAAPRLPVGDIPLFGEAEERQILGAWRGSAAPYPREALVHELFAAQAAQAGDRVAVEAGDTRLTYAELESRANQLAWHLRRLGVGPDDRVGLAVPRSPEMIVALLGILQAGGAYLPLDPSWPRERLATLAGEARPRVLVTLEPLLDRLPGGLPVVCLDRDREVLARERRTAPASGAIADGATADHLACVLFTSGSTGRPKGVAIPHRAVVRLVRGGGFARLDAGQTLLQLAPLSFDASTLEIWGALCNGGRLVLAPPEPPSLAGLGRLLSHHGVTTLWLTAGLFHQMVDLMEDEEIGSLRGLSQLLAGGDVLSPLHVQKALAALPGCALINGYGPTENTTFTACHRLEEAASEARVPIGRPIGNTTVVLLDRAGRPVPVGIPGELYAGGDGLARGYLGRPDLTAERFVPSPFAGKEDAAGARLYRTGDLARRRPDGTLDFLGRIDRQVKIRGFRIEPGEIEAALRTLPGVREAVVVARAEGESDRSVGSDGSVRSTGDRRLVAYVVGDAAPEALRAALRERLPVYMVPAFFMRLAALPLTPNGKLDRNALPHPEREAATGEPAAPRTPLEELVAGIWAEVLGLDRVGVDESFFDLGGHSLLATRAVSRLQSALGVELPVRALFEHPTVAAFAAAVEGASRVPAPPLLPHRHGTEIPLSPAQERLWFLDRLEPGNPAYNVPLALRLRGPVSAPALAAALAAVAGRHEVLRTRFVESAGRPEAAVSAVPRFPLALVDLSGLPGRTDRTDPSDLRARQALLQARREAERPFDLAAGPLCRAALLRLEAEEHLLVIDVHHIAFDGASAEILLRELGLLYTGEPLPPLPVQYADFALWQRAWIAGGALAGQLDIWRERLAGAPAALDLPADRPRPPVQTFRGGAVPVTLPAEQVRGLRALGRRGTLFMTVLAGWSALLHRMSGAPEVIVGAPVANRRQPGLEGLIGLFVNSLPLRVDLSGDPPFAELLDRVRTMALTAYENQDVPFELLVESVETGRDLSRSPLFQVMLALQDGAPAALRLPGVVCEDVPLQFIHNDTAKFELLLALNATEGGLSGGLEFNADLFDPATARRLADQLARLLAGAAAGARTRIGDLPLLAAAEERQILVEWNATAAPFPQGLGLHELFAAQAARTPEATALLHGERRVTYAELAAWAGRLAGRLRALGVGPEVLVGVFCGRTPGLVAAALAVLEAGGAYLPLDPAYPADRLRFLLADSGASVVLAEAGVAAALPAFAGTVVLVDGVAGIPDAEPPRGFLHPDQAAYAIYTSGSTGVPKGVIVRHGSAVARITWALSAYPRDVLAGVLAATSLCFDLSVFEIFAPLAAGGTVILADDVLALPSLPDATAVTLVNTVPSAMAELVRDGGLPRSVRVVNLAGEPLRRDLAARLYAQGVEEVHNLYGPSEDTTYSTGARVERADEREPAIGRPLPNTRAYLLDPALRLVPVGAPGELWLGGAGLARGYLGRPDLTADRFRPDPFGPSGGRLYRTGDLARRRSDGALDYLGRLDHQVKIRGFRIELGEIEAALLAVPGVREAVVVARAEEESDRSVGSVGSTGDRLLVAYVVGDADAGTLRAALRERLPGHMVPATFVVLAALPLTPNGKVDRKALPAPEWQGAPAGAVAPRTPTEEVLCGIWAEVLGHEQVGIHDSFFDLGGHSLLATRVIARVQSVLGVELPVRALFEQPTVAALAAAVEGAARVPAPPVLPREAGSAAALSPAQERLWFLDRLAPGQAVYNMPMVLRLRGPVSAPRLAAALAAVALRHEVLRTTFTESAGRPEAVISAEPRFPLALVDLTGLPAQVRPAEAVRQAAAEARHPFDLAAGPLGRAALLRLDAEEHLLVIDVHHIAFDGGSMGVLLRELGLLYGGEPLPRLPVQYADFAAWQRAWLAGGALAAQLGAWRERLAGAPPALDLPTDRPRPPVQTFRGDAVPVTLPAELVRGLRALGRRTGSTLFMTVLAGWSALLHRLSGAPEVVAGSPVANRRQPELEGLIGLFVNTLPLRVDLGGDPPFSELLGRVRATALAAYENQDVPFERLVDALGTGRDLSRGPLFQVMLALQDGAAPALHLPGVTAEEVPIHNGTAKFELLLALQGAGDDLAGGLEYNSGLFEAATARRLADRLARLLAGAAAGPELRIGDLPLLDAAEERQILVEWNATAAPFPRDLGLHELFEAQAARTPRATALIHGTARMSYGALDAWADRLARRLRGLGAGPEVLVGVFCGRTPGLVAAALAVLKAGAAYLPLDPAYPADRLRFLLADSGASIVLTEESLAAVLPAFAGALVLVDGDSDEAGDADRPRGFVHPEQAAYAIYTSGSTGVPKGVLVRHGGAVARITWALSAYPRDVLAGVLAATSLCFDLSVFEIFAPLAAGGSVILADDALALPSLPGASSVTLVNTVPSAMAELVRSGGLPRSVRVVNLAGEPLRRDLAAKVYALEGIEEVHNLYGPSEDTTYSTGARVERGDEREPAIGRPLPNTRAYLLDSGLRLVPVGAPGELWLGGAGLARGYLGRPDLTADRFRPDPFGSSSGGRLYRTGDLARRRTDGTLDYLGRTDHQVKIRGFRIELGEVEAALLAVPGVREAVVVARAEEESDRSDRSDGSVRSTGSQKLVAYVAGDAAGGTLRAALRERLPVYMVPAVFVLLAALPLTPNGKVDRKALPAPEGTRPELDVSFVAPRTREEQAVAAAWREVLGIEKVGVYDNFFDLGGHSLLMVQVQARLRDAFAREIPILDLFQHPTVGALAQHLGAGPEETAGTASFETSDSRGESRRAKAAEQQLQRRRRRSGRTGDFEA